MSKLKDIKKIAEQFGEKAALKKASELGGALDSAANPVKTANPENLGKTAKGGFLRGAAEILAFPQKVASQKLAEAAGLKAGDSSEENFIALADKGGDALGIPRDSTAGNAVKAGAVALAEVFGDPLGFIPVGKVAKGIKGLGKMGPLQAIAKVAEESGAIKKAANVVKAEAPKVLKEAANVEAQKMARNVAIANLANDLKLAEKIKADEAAAKIAAGQPVYWNNKSKGLRPELQGKDSVEIWQDISAKQAAEPTTKLLNKPAPGPAKISQDRFLEKQGMDNAKKMGASKEDQPALAELFKRFRGGGK